MTGGKPDRHWRPVAGSSPRIDIERNKLPCSSREPASLHPFGGRTLPIDALFNNIDAVVQQWRV
jgi:hypothetical protein